MAKLFAQSITRVKADGIRVDCNNIKGSVFHLEISSEHFNGQ